MSKEAKEAKQDKSPQSPTFKVSPLLLKPVNRVNIIDKFVACKDTIEIQDDEPLDVQALKKADTSQIKVKPNQSSQPVKSQQNDQISELSNFQEQAKSEQVAPSEEPKKRKNAKHDKDQEVSEPKKQKKDKTSPVPKKADGSPEPKQKPDKQQAIPQPLKVSAATSPMLKLKPKSDISPPPISLNLAHSKVQTSPMVIENLEEEIVPAAKILPPKGGGILNFLKAAKPEAGSQKSGRFDKNNVVNEDNDMFKRVLLPQQPKLSFSEMLKSDFEQTVLIEEKMPEYPAKVPLINTLIRQGIAAGTAQKARRQLIAIFETAATLKYRPDRITQDGFQVGDAGAGGVDKFYEERRKNIERKLNEICKLYDENKPNESAGFALGVASVYIPGRVFYGYTPAPEFKNQLYVDPLQVEDEVNYDEETAGFDEPTEDPSSSEESEESLEEDQGVGEAKIDEDKDPAEYYRQLVFGNKQEDDDLDLEDEAGQLKVQGMKQQKQLFDFLGKRQAEFGFPVPVLCPEALQGQNCCFYEFDSSFLGTSLEQLKQLNENKKPIPEPKCTPKKQIINDQVCISNCTVPTFMRPVFLNVGKDLEELQNMLKDEDFEYYMEQDEQE